MTNLTFLVCLAFVSMAGCAANVMDRRQPAEEGSLSIRVTVLQAQLDLLRVDVRELELEIADLKRQISISERGD